MNAREAMKALLEGKILTAYGTVDYRLNDTGKIEQRGHKARVWTEYYTFMNDNPKIVEEYPLTFKEAVMAMLDGKIVVSEYYSGLRNKFEDGQFFHSIMYEYDWDITHGFENGETECKWKVVEE